MIRPAIHNDIRAIVELGEQLCAESPRWSRMRYSRKKVAAMVRSLIDNERGFAWVATREGVVVGALLAIADEHWASDDLMGQELTLYVSNDVRGGLYAARLISAMHAWGSEMGVLWLSAGTSTGIDPEGCAALYERLAFTRASIGLEVFYGR